MRSVMIVDDDMSAQNTLRDMLAKYPGYKITQATGTLKEAKHILTNDSPDILFLDLELPDGNGMELIDLVQEYHPEIYVVMFTAFYQSVGEEAYRHGEHDYLLKPILPDEFDKVIRRYEAAQNESTPKPTDLRKGKLFDTIALVAANNERRPAKSDEIGFFRYESDRKLWVAVLNDSSSLTLRKGTTAKDILDLSPIFQQSHQSFIVNLNYVNFFGTTKIRLRKPFQSYFIPMGRTFLHPFEDRFRQI
jgi:two-component system LytT family response regulator